MTDDELDLLASAYLDGEATPEEVALVERDPALQARVAELRSISERLRAPVPPPSEQLKERQLAAAMAGLGSLDAEPAATGPAHQQLAGAERGQVVDLREARRARSMPRWLPAAAVFLLLGGGVVWLAQSVGESDDADTASGVIERDESADVESETVAADAAAEATEEDMLAAEEGAATERQLAGDGEDAADEAATSAPAAEESMADDAAGGFAPLEPVAVFDEVPDPADVLDELPAPFEELERSSCSLDLELEPGSEPLGFLPIEIGDEPAEIYVVVDGDGRESVLIVDGRCETLAP